MSVSRREWMRGAAAVCTTAVIGTGTEAAADTRRSPRWQLPAKRPVTVTEHTTVPMSDGIQLSVRLWLPDDRTAAKVPVVLEYIPYRKRDLYRGHDNRWGQELAQYGIAYARLDARGSGDSQGILADEYLEQELKDGVETIAWLAKQSWCNGSVGMRGISWGGINTLQVAAKGPPALKAILPMCCTDTRYTDDAHYIGGALGLTDLQWGVQFKGVMALPPDPAVFGSAWQQEWQSRLESSPAIMETWLIHQRNDAYWTRGSVSSDYSAIQCPVFIVDGWVDTYVNTVPRILANVKAPRMALFGPWAHNYPDGVSPGPGLEWIVEEVRWWQQWLQGVDTGIMDEPMIRTFMPYNVSSEVYPKDTPGRWVGDKQWPPRSVSGDVWYLGAGRLTKKAATATAVQYRGDKIVGLQKPEWLPFPPEGMPGEQGPDDAKSLVYDSPPLSAHLEILGHPQAKFRIAADQPVAQVAVRLCEVTPQGKSWLVTYGLLNLTHRNGHEEPTPLVPGQFYDVTIDLSLIAHRFKRGNRIRLSISESLWPLVWPSPRVATLALMEGESKLELPVRSVIADPPFSIPVKPTDGKPGATRATPEASGPDAEGWYRIEQKAPEVTYTVEDTGTAVSGIMGQREILKIREGDNGSCVWQGEVSTGFKRDGWNTAVHASYRLACTPDTFTIEESLTAAQDGEEIFKRTNKATLRRDLI